MSVSVSDPIERLIDQRGDEMSPSLRAFATASRFWLWLAAAAATCGSIALGLVVSFYFLRQSPFGFLSYFLIALPCAALGHIGSQRLREYTAARIALAIERRLNAIGGESSSVALPLRMIVGRGCPHERVRVDVLAGPTMWRDLDVRDLKETLTKETAPRFVSVTRVRCGRCARDLDVDELGDRVSTGGDLFDPKIGWRPPMPVG